MTGKVNNWVESESDLRMNRKGNEPFKITVQDKPNRNPQMIIETRLHRRVLFLILRRKQVIEGGNKNE